MKIYTKTGDKGNTTLFGGTKTVKDDIRIESYGTVDELNSFVGLLRDSLQIEEIKDILFTIQNKCFNIGSVLATDPSKGIKLPGVTEEDILFLESSIDKMEEELPALSNFILPGGGISVSYAHVCRTVCRRAERLVVKLSRIAETDELILKYLNRLSDYFFVCARYIAKKTNVQEVIWKNN